MRGGAGEGNGEKDDEIQEEIDLLSDDGMNDWIIADETKEGEKEKTEKETTGDGHGAEDDGPLVSGSPSVRIPDGILTFPVGKCCIGDRCRFPALELRKEHRCITCKKIVHLVGCSVPDDEVEDGYECLDCKES